MFRILKFIKNVFLLNGRLTAEEERQKKEGYLIEFIHEGPQYYFKYYEGDREVSVGVDFTYLNDAKIYTKSFVKWSKPRGEELTPFDYQKILNRLVRYLSCWGGEVILDNSHIKDLEEIKAELDRDGIKYQEIDGVLMYQSTVEDEKKRKNPMFDK